MNYANHIGYSDVNPYEVVRVISDKTLEVREMSATRDRSTALEFIPGGFTAHCKNQDEQKWIIESDPRRPIVRIRLGKNGWKDKDGRKFRLSDRPIKFYDYNF